jgi:hypothetical protein
MLVLLPPQDPIIPVDAIITAEQQPPTSQGPFDRLRRRPRLLEVKLLAPNIYSLI